MKINTESDDIGRIKNKIKKLKEEKKYKNIIEEKKKN